MDGRCAPERCKICSTCKSESFKNFLKAKAKENEKTILQIAQERIQKEKDEARDKARNETFQTIIDDLNQDYDLTVLKRNKDLLIEVFELGKSYGHMYGYNEGRYSDRAGDIFYD